MTMAVENHNTWASRDQFRALLFTLLVKTTAHNLGTFLDRIGRKICVINCLLNSSNQIRCAVIGFGSSENLESVYHTESIFGEIKCFWTRLDLVYYGNCEHFGHFSVKCDAPIVLSTKPSKSVKRLAKLYVKKGVPIFHPAVVSLASSSGGSLSGSGSGSGFSSSGVLHDKRSMLINHVDSSIHNCLALLKCFLKLLADQVSSILCRLNGMELVPLVSVPNVGPPVGSALVKLVLNADMVLNVSQLLFLPPSSIVESKTVDLGLSSSKILTFKVGSLKFKMVAFEVSIGLILGKLDLLCVNLDSLASLVTCNVRGIMNLSKQDDIVYWYKKSGNMISIVFTTGLDVGFCGAGVAIIMDTFLAWHILKVEEILGHLISVCLLFKNKLSVTILGLYAGAFIGTHFGQAADINFMVFKAINSSFFVILDGDFNENSFQKSVNFKFCLGLGLVNIFVRYLLTKSPTWSNSRGVERVIDFILMSENLASAIVLYKVDDMSEFFNTDYKSVSVLVGLSGLLDACLINICKQANRNQWKFKIKDLLVRSDMFEEVRNNSNLNMMWRILEETIVQAANKIVKYWNSDNLLDFNHLVKVWLAIDEVEAFKINGMVLAGVNSIDLVKHLLVIKKKYWRSKYCEFKSILEHLFYKVVLDYLVVEDKLVFESDEVKLKVDEIIKGWTKKWSVLPKIPDLWFRQYMSLDYVNGSTFSDVINKIGMEKLSLVVGNLPNDKAISMIPKPYEWNGILTNTRPIALIDTACKILSKILFDRISLACSKFNVFCGDNFLVLKGTSTQSPIFVIGSVIENALEKNRELWLILQNMHKAYNSVGWHHLRASLVITDFGLSTGYKMHDKLDQREVFSLLLWRIFYDSLLCEVKRHKHLCGYRIDFRFVVKFGRIKVSGKKTFFLAAGAFIDNTIWVGSSYASMQYILNIASEFFVINDISINSDKIVAILINQGIKDTSLLINRSLISIAKKDELHWYLGIFLSTEDLSKPSIA
ncbi:hypothetical protein G9A89_006607 [Geosiphon pyriformis]|nr:hypothetical protein G9A89_006607 [Geosiphon pyriformis]